MKVSRITLNNFLQFKRLDLDLTYPKGHKKEGMPLDKICFIGQSGTGKTTLLRILKLFVSRNRIIGPNLNFPSITKSQISVDIHHDDLFSRQTADDKDFIVAKTSHQGKAISFEKWLEMALAHEDSIKPLLINYPAEVVRGKPVISNLENDDLRKRKISEKLSYIENLEPQRIVDFTIEEIETVRNFVFKEIKDHRANELFFKNKISEVVLKPSSSPADIKKANLEYERWLKRHPNPLTSLAHECLDPILANFGLKIKTKMDLDTILALGDIQLETMEGNEVDRTFWSTGTRQIVDTLVPLFELKPKNAIVIMDEPEKSLFPDIQEKIIDSYVRLSPSCQFFFATHSPLIASSFDPWEVFHFEFNESSSSVELAFNYVGARNVANYSYHPKYLRWDSILMNVFGMKDDGPDSRDEILLKLASLNIFLKKGRQEKKDHTAEFKRKYIEFLNLAKLVGWDEKVIKGN